MKRIIPACVVLFIIFSGCGSRKQENIDILLDKTAGISANSVREGMYGIITVDRLRMRSTNDIHAKTLRYLDRGCIVDIIGKDENRTRVDDMEDYWYKIEYNNIKGWVFGYYLEPCANYRSALMSAQKYGFAASGDDLTDDTVNNQFIDEYINNNLLFISDGKLLQITDIAQGKAKLVPTVTGIYISDYMIISGSDDIYYTGYQTGGDSQNNTLYHFGGGANDVLIKGLSKCTVDTWNHRFITASQEKSGGTSYWVIKSVGTADKKDERIIAKIVKSKTYTENQYDRFTIALSREKGSIIYLEFDPNKNAVTFKPPEEDLAYVIALADGSFTRIQLIKPVDFKLDANRSFRIENVMNDDGSIGYSLILKDAVSGNSKEIIRSPSYPLRCELSSANDLVAVSMVATDKTSASLYPSSVYIISLTTLAVIPISTDGVSYHPQWRH